MSNANEPAFPIPYVLDEVQGLKIRYEVGLTKRELIAAMALQGILSNPDVKPKYQAPIVDAERIESVNQDYARIATNLADALLAELAK